MTKAYIGTKIVQATPMTLGTFNKTHGKDYKPSDRNKQGYMVIYEDGYESWSPKDVFERAYREVSANEASMIATSGD